MTKEKILITAALPYANGNIHLGHLSGAYLPADIFARYNRLKGKDVLFLCGSDEHGVPITISADKENVKPKVIIDRYHESNRSSFEKFGMSFDIYSRTSIPVHHETAKEFFLDFYSRGILKEKKSLQFYDEKAGMFLPDRYVEGVCPNCGFEQARSDECENCGALYEPSELKNPVSKVSGDRPVLKETAHWFFPLGEYQKRLEDYVNSSNNKFGWKENVMQYCRGWFKSGLQDRAITRDIDWGIPVPLNDSEGKVIYVWFEAVLGYISAAKELSEKKKSASLWRNYWQNKNTRYIAFIGKDNVVFHCIIFPAILMAWNDGGKDQYILPENVPANEFLNFEGKKFSKSRNWGIDVEEFLNIFPADPLRYTLAANLPETRDTDFYWKEFQARNNSELADILGNFINRTFTFVHKHFKGQVPERGELLEIDEQMLKLREEFPTRISGYFDKYKFRDGVQEIMNLARAGNKYFNDSEPWKTVKSDKERCATTLNICLNTIYTLAGLFYPIIPFSSEKIFTMLNSEKTNWDKLAKEHSVPEDHQLNKTEIIFPKIEDEIIDKQINKLGIPVDAPLEEEKISVDDFYKIHLKTAKVIYAEKVPKSDKLLKLKIQIGSEERQIVAGIAGSYQPEQISGKTIVVVANLKPAKLMGQESNGMLLAAHSKEGIKVLFLDDNVESGASIK